MSLIETLFKNDDFSIIRIGEDSISISIRKLNRKKLYDLQQAITCNMKDVKHININLFTNNISMDNTIRLMIDLSSLKRIYKVETIGIWNETRKTNKFIDSVR